MTRIVYISGRYRHYLPNGNYHEGLMHMACEEEQEWVKLVAECGMMWYAPLANTIFLEGISKVTQQEFIEGDLAIIRRLRPNYDVILMRPGWEDEPESKGARQEHDAAVEHGLLVAHGKHGRDAVREYLCKLNGVNA